MKNLFLLLFSLLAFNAGAQTITYYSEDFQLGKDPEEMTYYDVDGLPIHSSLNGTGLGKWHVLRNSLTDTNYFMGSTSKFATPGQANDWMITPQLKIYGQGATISWQAIVCDNSTKRDGYKVYVSTTGKEVADFKDEPIFSIDEESSEQWVGHSVSLDKYAGELVYIAFVNDSYDKYVLGIDDILISGPKPALDFSFITPSMTDNGKVNVSVEVTGNSDKTIDACKMYYKLGEETYSQEFTGLNLSEGQSTTLTMDKAIEVKLNESVSYKAWIEVDGDTYLPGDFIVEGTYFVPTRKVVIEEGTGIWCNNCPMGIVAFEYLEKWYPDNFIGIAIHGGQTGEPMGFDAYLNFLGINLFPMGVVDRKHMASPAEATGSKYSLLGSGFEGTFLKALKQIPVAEIKGTCEIDKSETDYLKIKTTLTTRFTKDMNNPGFLIAIILIEDSVTAADGTMYIQENKFGSSFFKGIGITASKETLEDMGGFANKSPYVLMKFNHVARAAFGDSYEGLDPEFPAKLEGGKEYNIPLNLTFTKGAVNNPEYSHVVALLIDEKGQIANACKIALGTESVGLHSNDRTASLTAEIEHSNLLVTVNKESPVTVELYNTNGKKLSIQNALVDKSHKFSFSTESNGLYIIKISSGTSCITRKIIL